MLLAQGEADAYGTPAQLDDTEAGGRGPVLRLVLPGVGHAADAEAAPAVVPRGVGLPRDAAGHRRAVRARHIAGGPVMPAFGLRYANIGPLSRREPSIELARFAEEAGFESIWTIEHVVIPAGYRSAYPYSEDGRFGWPEDLDYPDPLMWLAVIAGATERIRLGTAIVILPQRNPLVLAKELATLDVMSGGRVLFGVGVGWLREEFDAIGVPFEERGARTDEAVAALRCLWSEPEPTFDGRFFSFQRALMHPKPVQQPGIPVIVGGHSRAAARRAGRIGDGFFPARATPETLPPLLDEVRRAAEEAGRDPSSIEITAGNVEDAASVERFLALGADRLMCPLMLPTLIDDLDEAKRRIERFAEQVMTRF